MNKAKEFLHGDVCRIRNKFGIHRFTSENENVEAALHSTELYATPCTDILQKRVVNAIRMFFKISSMPTMIDIMSVSEHLLMMFGFVSTTLFTRLCAQNKNFRLETSFIFPKLDPLSSKDIHLTGSLKFL